MRSIKLLLFLAFLANIVRADTTPPDFSVFTTHNDSFHLHDDYLDEGKVVMIEFFFTTCPPCKDIAPYMEGLYQDWGAGDGDVEFILITNKSFDDNVDVAQYADNYGFSFPGVGVDGGALGVWNLYKDSPWGSIFGTPAYIVIAPDGSVQYDVKGATVQSTIDSLDAALARAVNTIQQPPAKSFNKIVSTHYKSGDTIQDVEALYYNYPNIGDTSVGMPIQNGQFTEFLPDSLPSTADFSLQMHKNEPSHIVDGISTFDILLIQLDVLEYIELGFFETIAGDINRDGKLSGGDLINIRRVILGLVSDYGPWPTWRFFPDYVPENQLDSLQYDEFWDFPDEWDYAPESENSSYLSFKGVKIGDVNGSWSSSFTEGKNAEVRSPLKIKLVSEYDEQDGEYVFHVQKLTELTYSFQLDLSFNNADDLEVSSPLSSNHFFAGQISPTTIRLGFYDVDGKMFRADQALFTISGVKDKKQSGIELSASEWYTDLEASKEVVLLKGEVDQSIQMYPNPVQDFITIFSKEPEILILRDIQAVPIMEIKLDGGMKEIDMSSLPVGQYFLGDHSGQWSKVIIKQ